MANQNKSKFGNHLITNAVVIARSDSDVAISK